MIEPIVKEISVPIGANAAFDVFTKNIGDWWPLDTHSRSAASAGTPAKSVHMTPRLGGSITEIMADGSEAQWGNITKWVVGEELAFTWHLGRAKGQQTLVTVTFEGAGDVTRVRLVHSGWAALGADGPIQRQQYAGGWDLVFGQQYAGAAA